MSWYMRGFTPELIGWIVIGSLAYLFLRRPRR